MKSLYYKKVFHIPIKNLTLLVTSTTMRITYHWYDRKGLEWQNRNSHETRQKY